MSDELPQEITIEVRTQRAGDDPWIKIFRSGVTTERGVWTETHGSVGLLRSYLKGLETSLRLLGYGAHLSWDFPETFHEPSGKRWRVRRGEMFEMEELNSDGEVIRI